MRTEFLAIVSHELRVPLTSIKGSAGAELDASPGFAPEEMLQFFRIINAQADQMGRLISDLLGRPVSQDPAGRVRAALRRQPEPEPFELGELAIDYERRHVTLAGRAVHLTATEYEVLRSLSANAGRVLTYQFLLRHAWVRYPDRASPKLVHAVVKRLRRKLGEDAATAAYILNERHVGYRMPADGD